MKNPTLCQWEVTDRLRRRLREAEQARLIRRAEQARLVRRAERPHKVSGLWVRMGVFLNALVASLRLPRLGGSAR